MSRNLSERLPRIIAEGRQRAERILEICHSITLETREWVLPAKDSALLNWIKADKRRRRMNAQAEVPPNRLIHGDDLLVMAALLAGDAAMPSLRGKLELIHVDCCRDVFQPEAVPPERPGKPTVTGQSARPDQQEHDTVAYLAMLVPRLFLMRELLSDHGLVCLHADMQVKCFIKMVIEDIFGRQDLSDHILSESALVDASDPNGKFRQPRYSVLLFGKAGADRCGRKTLRDSIEEDAGSRRDFGRIFPMQAMPERPDPESLMIEQKKIRGNIIDISTDHARRCSPRMDTGSARSKETISDAGKEAALLLEAIILASTRLESMVADFSGRSGDTAVIAERLARRWITSDNGKSACAHIRSRLIGQNAEPFLFQEIDGALEKAAGGLAGESFRAGDLSQIVLLLYGALPLPSEDDPDRNLGQMPNAGSKTLVLVGPANESIGLAHLKKAAAQRNSLAGGWDKVVVLGWKFEPSISASIAALNDARLEVMAIPANLLDLLKKEDNGENLHGNVCFAETQD